MPVSTHYRLLSWLLLVARYKQNDANDEQKVKDEQNDVQIDKIYILVTSNTIVNEYAV